MKKGVVMMNWDLLIGVIAGGSISLINIIGSIITNRQNNNHALKKQRQSLIMESAFKEYEYRTNHVKDNIRPGESAYLFPFDMYLVTYAKIAEYMEKKSLSKKDIDDMLKDMKTISASYRQHNNI